MDHQGLTSLKGTMFEDIDIDGQGRFGQGCGLHKVQSFGHRQGMTAIDHAILCIAAAAEQGGDLIPDLPALGALTDGDNLARGLEAENVGCAGRWWIEANPLQDIRAIDPGRAGFDEDFAWPRLRNGALFRE